MKFFLTIQVCSALIGQCMNPMQLNQPFNSHYECMHAGALNMIELSQNMGSDYVNEKKIIIKFTCTEQNFS